MRTDFNIISISDSNHSKINSNQMMLLPNYRYEFCPTVTNTGGTMIYIRNHLIYKVRSSSNIYKSFELQSLFIEIRNLKKINFFIGCINKHRNVSITELNNDYLIEVLDKLSKENKIIFFLGGFKINMFKLKYLSTH